MQVDKQIWGGSLGCLTREIHQCVVNEPHVDQALTEPEPRVALLS